MALAEMPNPVKNADNPAFKRDGKPMRYADLEATLEACKPILSALHVAVLQFPVSSESGIGVRTKLLGYGEEIDCGEFFLPLEGQTPQKAAGAITYARRYALTAIFGLAQEDDDANNASVTTARPAAKPDAIGSDAPIVRAIFGKKKALGMTDAVLTAALKRDYGKEHPGDLTMLEAKQLADKMEAAIEKAKAEDAEPEPMTAEELAGQPPIEF
jgi:hypothetical protein